MLQSLTTEKPNEATEEIDLVDSELIMKLIHQQDRVAFDAVNSIIPALSELASDVGDRWQGGGRIIYIGAGTSGRLGVLDAAELPPTYSTDPQRAIGVIAGGKESVFLSREGAEDKPEDADKKEDDYDNEGTSDAMPVPWLGSITTGRCVRSCR